MDDRYRWKSFSLIESLSGLQDSRLRLSRKFGESWGGEVALRISSSLFIGWSLLAGRIRFGQGWSCIKSFGELIFSIDRD